MPLDPHVVTVGSDARVWWRCRKHPDEHRWQAMVSNRVNQEQGCPFCGSRRLCSTNSLAARNPALSAQWHPTLNAPLTPDDVMPGTSRMAWWQCERNPAHVWRSRILSRTNGRGCPFCSGHSVLVEDSLAARFPELAEEWSPRRNGRLKPEHVSPGYTRPVWWKCRQGPDHEWQQPPETRTRRGGTSCPFCRNRRVSVTNCLATVAPRIAEEWHPTKNAPLRPEAVIATGRRSVWWRCHKRHEWKARLAARVLREAGCPACDLPPAGKRRKRR